MKEKSYDKFKGNMVEGRTCVHSVEFPSENNVFYSYYQATEFLKEMGYTIASMCSHYPIGFSKKYSYIAKWSNLTSDEKQLVDGIILPLDDFRNGACSVIFFNEPEY